MEIELDFSPAFTMATARLAPGESIKVEPGAMVSQSLGLDLKTGMSGGGGLGGFLKSMAKAALGGESFFLNTFTAGQGGGWVSLAPSAPGDIKSFDIAPGSNIFMQGGAFLACTHNVNYDTKFQGAKSLFTREKACSSSEPSRREERGKSSTLHTGLSRRLMSHRQHPYEWITAIWLHSQMAYSTEWYHQGG